MKCFTYWVKLLPNAVKPASTCFWNCRSISDRVADPHAGLDSCHSPANNLGTTNGPSWNVSMAGSWAMTDVGLSPERGAGIMDSDS